MCLKDDIFDLPPVGNVFWVVLSVVIIRVALDKINFWQVSLVMKITIIVIIIIIVISIIIMIPFVEYFTMCQVLWLTLYVHYFIHFSKYLMRYILLVIQFNREGCWDTERSNNLPKITQMEKKQSHTLNPMSLSLVLTLGVRNSRWYDVRAQEYRICAVLSTSTRTGTQLVRKPKSEDS